MRESGPPFLDPIRPGCRISVAIPAKNEEASIGGALSAFVRQCASDGSLLSPELFEVIVFANNCDDDTVGAVRRFAFENPLFAIHVLSCDLPSDAAHVGSARRIALDIACDRHARIRGDVGILATTDADSIVDRFWIAQTLAEMAHVDVVAGHVEIANAELEAMDESMQRLYACECLYRRLLGDLEATYDPRPFDPPLRHDSFVGASIAARIGTYVEAGRLPILRQLEDVAFAKALRRIDARIRHSYAVRVETSARAITRVVGGFGTYIDYIRDRSSRGETYLVDNGMRSVLRAKTRGLLRSYWALPDNARYIVEAASLYHMRPDELLSYVDVSSPFGETLDRVEATAIPFEAWPEEPVEDAIATIREAISANATAIRIASP